MKAIFAVIVGCVVALVATSPGANATTINFGTYGGPAVIDFIGTPYTESGFVFTNSGGFDRWLNGGEHDSDPTASTGLVTDFNYITTFMSRLDGEAFDLLSLDVDDPFGNGSRSGFLDYQYGLLGGGSGAGSYFVDNVPGFSTILLNLASLTYFSFTPSHDLRWVQFDNAQVAPGIVPIPATLPLFASALMALGWIARRRSKAEAGVPIRCA